MRALSLSLQLLLRGFSFKVGVFRADGLSSLLHFKANCSVFDGHFVNQCTLSAIHKNTPILYISHLPCKYLKLLWNHNFKKPFWSILRTKPSAIVNQQNHHQQKPFQLKLHRWFSVVSGSGGLDCVIIQQDRNYLHSYINFWTFHK